MNIKKRVAVYISISILLIATIIFTIVLSHKNGDEIVVGISNGFVGNNWRNQMLEDIYTAAEYYQELGLIQEFIVQNAGQDTNNQITQIKYLIKSDVDLLLINPNDYEGLNEVIEEAHKKGILVIVYDQNVSSELAYQVTINQFSWGQELALWLAQELKGVGEIALVEGVKSQPCNTKRVEGMLSILQKYPDIKIIQRLNGDWDQSSAKKMMTEELALGTKLNGILSQDGMGLGILQAYNISEKEVPLMTGETMNAFMEEALKLSTITSFKTFALSNPPGIGATALSFGLYLLEHPDQAGQKKQYDFPHRQVLINQGKAISNEITIGAIGTYYYDEWFTVNEVEQYFFNGE